MQHLAQSSGEFLHFRWLPFTLIVRNIVPRSISGYTSLIRAKQTVNLLDEFQHLG
jgi:hypothetical protein